MSVGSVVMRLFNVRRIQYRVGFYTVDTAKSWNVEDIHSLIFINQGTTTAVIEGQLKIAPNASFSVPGELFEGTDMKWNISFTGTGVNELVIAYKEYI